MSRRLEIDIIELLEDGPVWREDIARLLKKPRTTIFDHLKRLKQKDIVESYRKKDNDMRGASKTFWKLKVYEATIHQLEEELNRLKEPLVEELEYKLNRLKKKSMVKV